MGDTFFDRFGACARAIGIDMSGEELAKMSQDNGFTSEQLRAVSMVAEHLKEKKAQAVITTLLRMSRLPLTDPKTFENFDFTRIHGKDAQELRGLSSLAPVYARANMAFIGPPGTGKTHLAKAIGHKCCENGMKSYFLKATELGEKLTNARRLGHEESTIRSLVKPTCLIVDEVGRCVFDKENTRMFFDIVDRRYGKDGPNTTIFTSNMTPDRWRECFTEESSLLCALDRLFDKANVYMIKGDSYRGRGLRTFSIEAGDGTRNS